MQFPPTAGQVSRCIPLAIGYGVILALFLKSRCDLKRFRRQAEAAGVPANPAPPGQGSDATSGALEASAVGAATQQSHHPAARADLLRTYRRAETAHRLAAALAAGPRR
jgi:hypothetical protein